MTSRWGILLHACKVGMHEEDIIVIISTCYCCLEARCVCRQAAVKAANILILVALPKSKQDPINQGHGAQYSNK